MLRIRHTSSDKNRIVIYIPKASRNGKRCCDRTPERGGESRQNGIGKKQHNITWKLDNRISNRNKIRHFANDTDRKSELIIGKESAITKNHHIDCTNSVHIGDFTTIAGYNSIFLTHSIDIYENRQSSRPISVGNYCFVSTNAKVMGGCRLPDNSALAAGAVLTKVYTDEWTIYGGIPARPIKKIPATAKYFHREKGFVY